MIKIPEQYGRVIRLKNTTKNTKDKIKKIESIIEYLEKQTPLNQLLFLEDYKINIIFLEDELCGTSRDLNLDRSIYEASNDSIENLYNYIFPQKSIFDFFEDKDECLEVFNKENFSDLKIVLDECFNCIQAGNNFATVIMIRSCVEIWLKEMKITGKQDEIIKDRVEDFIKKIETKALNTKEILLLWSKEMKITGKQNERIEDFIKKIETDSQYEVLRSKASNIKEILFLYIENGNNVAHTRIKQAQEYIENHCLEASLNLLCKLIEITILKDDIIKIKNKNQEEKIKNIDFNTKKISIEQNNKNFVDNADDEIPF